MARFFSKRSTGGSGISTQNSTHARCSISNFTVTTLKEVHFAEDGTTPKEKKRRIPLETVTQDFPSYFALFQSCRKSVTIKREILKDAEKVAFSNHIWTVATLDCADDPVFNTLRSHWEAVRVALFRVHASNRQ